MENQDLFAAEMPSEKQPAQKKLVRRSAITDDALAHFREPYSAADAARIGKEDIFYYIYGLLHSEEYRERYADNLSKQLPRIPRMKNYADFSAFSRAGRDLAALHLNYETVPIYQGVKFSGSLQGLKLAPQQIIGGADEDFRVVKMKFVWGSDSFVIAARAGGLAKIPIQSNTSGTKPPNLQNAKNRVKMSKKLSFLRGFCHRTIKNLAGMMSAYSFMPQSHR